MFEKAAFAMGSYLQEGLLLLKQIFEHASSEQACRDNAVAAICRIIYTVNPPMPHQIFVDNLVKMMPFTGDEEEEGVALRAIVFLYTKNPGLILGHREALVKIIKNDLGQPEKYHLKEPLLADLHTFLGKLGS
jgi:hypothetical protein